MAPASPLSRQQFAKRRPVIPLPSGAQARRLAVGKATVIENNPRAARGVHNLKSRNGIKTRAPARRAPRLNDQLIGLQQNLPARDVAAEQGERAAFYRTQRRRHFGVNALHDAAQLNHLIELLRVGERLVHARGWRRIPVPGGSILRSGLCLCRRAALRRRSAALRSRPQQAHRPPTPRDARRKHRPNSRRSMRPIQTDWSYTCDPPFVPSPVDQRGATGRAKFMTSSAIKSRI